jgi:hypothetical protein
MPIRIRKILQLQKGKYHNYRKENIPIRKRKYFQFELGNWEMAEQEEEEDENKRIRPRERARGQKKVKIGVFLLASHAPKN